jgi:hypothetical protein
MVSLPLSTPRKCNFGSDQLHVTWGAEMPQQLQNVQIQDDTLVWVAKHNSIQRNSHLMVLNLAFISSLSQRNIKPVMEYAKKT